MGDVGLRCDHHASDGGAGEACGSGATQDAQDVVLGCGEPKGLQALLERAMEAVCAAHESEQRFLLGTGEAEGLLGSR